MKADPDQLERIALEGWSADELAVRADVPRDAVMRWQRHDYAPMPYAVAERLVAQADGVSPPPPAVLLALNTLCARRARRMTV